jgi:hypothetical protein
MCRSTNQRCARLVARIGPKRPLRAHIRCALVADKAQALQRNLAATRTGDGGGRLSKVPLGMGAAGHYLAATAWRISRDRRRVRSPEWAALAQLVRALDCGSRGPPFEPGRRYQLAPPLAGASNTRARPLLVAPPRQHHPIAVRRPQRRPHDQHRPPHRRAARRPQARHTPPVGVPKRLPAQAPSRRSCSRAALAASRAASSVAAASSPSAALSSAAISAASMASTSSARSASTVSRF